MKEGEEKGKKGGREQKLSSGGIRRAYDTAVTGET
jgi:hypothetical protein